MCVSSAAGFNAGWSQAAEVPRWCFRQCVPGSRQCGSCMLPWALWQCLQPACAPLCTQMAACSSELVGRLNASPSPCKRAGHATMSGVPQPPNPPGCSIWAGHRHCCCHLPRCQRVHGGCLSHPHSRRQAASHEYGTDVMGQLCSLRTLPIFFTNQRVAHTLAT